MDEVTVDEILRTCAIQAARLEKLRQENARLAAERDHAMAAATAADAEVAKLRAAAEATPNKGG